MKMPNIVSSVIQLDFDYTLLWIHHIVGNLLIEVNDLQFESGVSLLADPVNGAPIIKVYNATIDLGSSMIMVTDNLFLEC